MSRILGKLFACALVASGFFVFAPAFAAVPSTLYRAAPQNFTTDTRYVTADLFTWFGTNSGQTVANWTPLEGRPAWNGGVDYWKDQLKQIMSANIDTLYVHSWGLDFRTSRRNLFNAMSQLRSQGYDVPKVAPWPEDFMSGTVNVATTAGKDTFVNSFKNFFNDYYQYNTDPYADSYLHQVYGKVVLNVWETRSKLVNHSALTRADVENRLKSTYGAAHPVFNNGIHMTSLVYIDPNISFLDEMIPQYQATDRLVYYYPGNTNQYDGGNQPYHNNYKTASISPGFWNQNYLSPSQGGKILPRDGGTHYTEAWNTAIADRDTLKHVKIESWNEYSEGSGIFRANPTPVRDSDVTATDTWSTTGDPLHYIKATAEGARQFNDNPDLDAAVLYEEFPATMTPGQVLTIPVVVRNAGDLAWKHSLGFKLDQLDSDSAQFALGAFINDAAAEVTTYGGIFRGAPYTFSLTITAPLAPGHYETHWGMSQNGVFFGDAIVAGITVAPEPGAFALGGVALAGLLAMGVYRRRGSRRG